MDYRRIAVLACYEHGEYHVAPDWHRRGRALDHERLLSPQGGRCGVRDQ
jgi:hypothetical protein